MTLRRAFIASFLCASLASCVGAPAPSPPFDPDDPEAFEEWCYDGAGVNGMEDVCHFGAELVVGRPFARSWERLVTAVFPYGLPYAAGDGFGSPIEGTDLGVNVRARGETWWFFGDTFPAARIDGEPTGAPFGLPVAVDEDGDLVLDAVLVRDDDPGAFLSVTEAVAVDGNGEPTGLFNDTEFARWRATGVEFPFFVPTGAFASHDESAIWYAYGKYINNTECDQSHLARFDLETGGWRYIGPIAEQKFIQIAAIPISASDGWWTDESCPPPFATDDERGFLLFGTGPAVANTVSFDEADPAHGAYCAADGEIGYRESRLYLAYIDEDSLDAPDPGEAAFAFVGAGGDGPCWRRGDLDRAVPVTPDPGLGEFSVRRVPGTDFLVMAGGASADAGAEWAYGHPAYWSLYRGAMFLRVSHISRPWAWSPPQGANTLGYGNYIPEDAMKFFPVRRIDGEARATNVLRFARAVSSWPGIEADPELVEYGVSLVWSVVDLTGAMASVAPK
ncbi:MAG: hypothetical protein KJ042_00995 [Deltaproteobacteria bacterium]|nr:hypothetical protein [Deltaproteobacteria bacterium]